MICLVQLTRIPTSARISGFCVIWVCVGVSSSSGAFVYIHIPMYIDSKRGGMATEGI